MDWQNVTGQLLKLADTVSDIIPQASTVKGVVELGEKVIDIIDDFSSKAPRDSQEVLQQRRARLSATVKAHAARTSAELRGKK